MHEALPDCNYVLSGWIDDKVNGYGELDVIRVL